MAIRKNITAIAMILALFMTARLAYGVIPSLLGPLQGLLAILPQILIFLAAGFAALFSFKQWRMRFSRLMSAKLKTKIIILVSVIVLVVGSVSFWVFYDGYSAKQGIRTTAKSQGAQATLKTWSAFRGGLMRTGNVDLKPGPSKGESIWLMRDPDFKAGDFSSSPAVVGDRIYTGSSQASVFFSSGMVYCLDAGSGNVIWKFQTRREIFSSPAVVNNKVYIGEGLHRDIDAKLYCLNAANGKLIWSFQTTSHVESSPTVVDGKVFFGGGEDGLYCVDSETGKRIWRYPAINVSLSPAIYDGKVYMGSGYGDMSIYCLDAETGTQIWKRQLKYPVWGSPSLSEGKLYFGTGNGNFVESDKNPGGEVVCVDADTSEIIWSYKVNDSVLTAIALGHGRAYFGSRDGNLYCVDADSGDLMWKMEIGKPVLSSPAVSDKQIYFGADNGVLYCLNSLDGSLEWKYDITTTASRGAKILSSPVVANGKIYVGSTKQYFFCIGETS